MISSLSNIRHILVIEDRQGRRTISLEEIKYSLGRKSDNSIILYSKQASRQHAALVKKGINQTNYSYWILDGDLEGNKSHNGIYINGTKCLVHELKDGDLINFGCEVNASYHLIINVADNQSKSPLDRAVITLTTQEESIPTSNPNQKSTLILDSPSFVNFDDTIQDQAYLDVLTDLPNRSLFNEYLSIAINNADRNNKPLGLLLVDIEQLRNVNDNLGHLIGDELLKIFSERLKESLRSGDIVARWGGDEFIILLPQINVLNDLEKISQRLLTILQPTYEIENHFIPLQTSLGSVVYSQDGNDSRTILKKLEKNLAQTKQERQNIVQLEQSTLKAKSTRVSKIESLLYQAIKNEELFLYYQPQVNIKKGEIEGLEVLLRWQHPQFGMIAPNRFLPLAEETDLILLMNRWVVEKACQQAIAWQKEGLLYAPISINVSPRQFHDPQFVTTLSQVLTETELNAKFLEIEMTETSLLSNSAETHTIIHELKQLGLGLSLDDFGVGYASIGYLSQLPLTKLKIAQSLVKNLSKHPQETALISAAIALGKSFNLIVLAEGVETQEQLEILQNLGCERMQGNRISCPLPVTEATQFLAIHRTLSVQS